MENHIFTVIFTSKKIISRHILGYCILHLDVSYGLASCICYYNGPLYPIITLVDFSCFLNICIFRRFTKVIFKIGPILTFIAILLNC